MPKAKYAEIYKDLKRKIETGEYEFQELLPSENTLVQEYDCSRTVSYTHLDVYKRQPLNTVYMPVVNACLFITISCYVKCI